MTMAICLWCGGFKNGALTLCPSCSRRPRNDSDAALSLALSDDLAPKSLLAKFAHEIRRNERPSIPPDVMAQAQDALKDPQLRALLGAAPRESASTATAPSSRDETKKDAPGLKGSATARTVDPSPGLPLATNLHRNAFAILGVSIRDSRRRIVEAADERALEIDHDACQKARSDLTSPRTRLGVELSWLPGVSPRKAMQLLSGLAADPVGAYSEEGLPTLAHLNLMAAAFELSDGDENAPPPRHYIDTGALSEFVQEFARKVDELAPSEVMRDINEDRAISGFPEIRAVEQLEGELAERKRYYRDAIKGALNRLEASALVRVMTEVVDGATSGGDEHAPELIDELVDSYAVETQGVLESEAANVNKLVAATKGAAASGEKAVKPLVDKLIDVVRNWDSIAQPIQLSAKARGIDHEPSQAVAYSVRSLAIDLFNEHDMLSQSKRLTELLQDVFAEVPDVSERLEADVDALDRIFTERKEAEEQQSEWEKEITYREELGTFFKNVLSISPAGVEWKKQRYPLEGVSRVRWGGVRRSVNGVPTGTSYTIAFGDNQSEAVIDTAPEHTFTKFVDKLWRAVGIRIMTETLALLKSGRSLSFGEAVVHDDGVTLVKHKFFGANEPVRCAWSGVKVWSADGSFYIGAADDKKTYVALSYIEQANTHILEQIIRMAFKKAGLQRLSELLN